MTRTDTMDLATRARAWFEAQPSRHPAGRTPEWDMQPEHNRRASALHAARLPWNGRLEAFSTEDREDMPQTVLRAAADALWATDRSTPAMAAASALWTAAAELDLDAEGFALLNEETLRLGALLPIDAEGISCIDAKTLGALNAVLISLRNVVSMLGVTTAAIPFALAADLVLATWSFSHGRRRLPLPDEGGRDDALDVLGGMDFLAEATAPHDHHNEDPNMTLPTTPFRWPTVDGLAVTVHAVADDIVLGTLDGEKRANAWDAATGLLLVRDDDSPSTLDLDARPTAESAERPYTVVFYVDGDYGVETFVQEVFAADPGTAYDLGVDKAREDGGTSSGRTLGSSDWDNASEISVFVGHGLDGYGRD